MITAVLLIWLLLVAAVVHAFLTAEGGREVPGEGFERDPDA